MAFSDLDPVEQQLDTACQDMSTSQLITYIKTYHGAFGRDLAVDGQMEIGIFKGLKRIYGDKTAGLIVKWVFYRYKGVWNDEVVTFSSFAKGRKWWVDKMHLEMQAAQQGEMSRGSDVYSIGARKLSSL